MLILADCGGSNYASHHIFKWDLQRLANRLGINLRMAHYPPYCSKYNPIEHRYFCHVTRAWSGQLFSSMKVIKAGLRRVWTRAGLRSTHAVIDGVFELKRKASAGFLANSPIVFDNLLPKWNYTARPGGAL